MSKYTSLLAHFLLLFFVIIFYKNSEGQEVPYKIKKIVIDAGHGGKDPGAVGKKSKEKDITLAIALKLGNYIRKYIDGVEVIYTRKTDVFVELFRRSEIANENNADLFISIHVNSNPNSKPHGTSTYIMGLNKAKENLEVAKLENAAVYAEKDYKSKYSGFDPESPETDIILSLYQNTYLKQSTLLASKIEDQFTERAGRKSYGVRQAGLIVLWNCTMPSVLVETGFISNAEEEKYLMSDYGQTILASAIFRAFRAYKEEIESSSSAAIARNDSKSETKKDDKNKTSDKKKENPGEENRQTKSASDSISFRIQIMSSNKKIDLKSKQFKDIQDIEEIEIDGSFKYVCGKSGSCEDVLKLLPEIKKKFPGSFITAYHSDKKISVSEAIKLQKTDKK